MVLKPLHILVVCATAWLVLAPPHLARGQTADALVSQSLENAKCTRPDRKLIRRETNDGTVWSSESSGPSRYNGQVREFNDCTKRFVIDADRQINIIRTDALDRRDHVAADATAQIRVIEAQISAAVEAGNTGAPYAAPAQTGFPDPECDQTALRQKCLHDWIDQAKSEIRQIDANAHMVMGRIAADANRQIHEINVTIIAVLAEVHVAIREQSTALTEIKAETLPAEPLPGVENVTVTGPKLPHSADTPTGAGDPDAISCRAPQIRADSRLLGPEVCKRNREWALIFKRGEDLGPDGRTIVSSEKERTYNPQTCVTTYSTNGLPSFTANCSRGP